MVTFFWSRWGLISWNLVSNSIEFNFPRNETLEREGEREREGEILARNLYRNPFRGLWRRKIGNEEAIRFWPSFVFLFSFCLPPPSPHRFRAAFRIAVSRAASSSPWTPLAARSLYFVLVRIAQKKKIKKNLKNNTNCTAKSERN